MSASVTRGREITFNPSPYETVKVWAVITESVADGLAVDDKRSDMYDAALTNLLAKEIEEVAAVTSNPKSIVHDYRVDEGN